MTKIPDISIVIVNYNTYKYTAQCLDSIYENSTIASFEIIVVDNASSDKSAELLESMFKKIKLVRSPENRGISGGNNLGIRESTGKYVLLLNNDTIVLPGMLDRVVDFLESQPAAGGVGGNLMNPDGTFQSAANDFPTLWGEFLNITKFGYLVSPYYPSLPPFPEQREVDWLSTAFMLFRRDAIEEIDLMDEQFFIYSDETDLQYRLQEKGWKIYYLPDVKTVHFGGRSLTPWRGRKMAYRGRILFFIKHRRPFETMLLRAMFTLICSLKTIYWRLISVFPNWNERARYELKSNYEILRMTITGKI
ncbi:glycosyltransferase family 2 protein [Chloroflexota bacterium]